MTLGTIHTCARSLRTRDPFEFRARICYTGAVADCHREGLIIDRPVAPENRGWQSSFVATDELIEAWRSTPQSIADSESEEAREHACVKGEADAVMRHAREHQKRVEAEQRKQED